MGLERFYGVRAAEHTVQPRPQRARVGVSVLPEDDNLMHTNACFLLVFSAC